MVEDDLEIVLKKKFKFIRIPFVGRKYSRNDLVFQEKMHHKICGSWISPG